MEKLDALYYHNDEINRIRNMIKDYLNIEENNDDVSVALDLLAEDLFLDYVYRDDITILEVEKMKGR